MGKFENVLIFSDLDGTYLTERGTFVPRNDEAIRYFRSEGGLFSFATGRMEKNVCYAVPAIRELVNYPLLLNNGAVLYDIRTEDRIFSCFMEEETVMPLLEFATEQYAEVSVRASVPGGFLYAFDHPLLDRDFGRVREFVRKKPFREWDLSRIYKIVFRGDDDTLREMQKDLCDRFQGRVEIILAQQGILEVQRLGVSKGSSIEIVRREFREKGTPKRIVCIGDYENDLKMLKAADLAACPSNAIESVKAIADVTLCHCEEGAVADLIEYLEDHPDF